MKALAILLLLVTVAWGGEWITNADCNYKICTGDKCECINLPIPASKVEKGHCPHCGAKGDPMSNVSFSAEKGTYTVYFCPNGHIFNEKD